MKKYFLWVMLFALSACGTTPTDYSPKSMEVAEALVIVEELTYSQHQAWRPQYFEISSNYIGWDYGLVSKHSSSSVLVGNTSLAVGSGRTSTRAVTDRVYFRSIGGIKLLDWTRKGRQWWVVSIYDKNGQLAKHAFRTRNLEDAKLFADALNSIFLAQLSEQ